MNAHPLRGVWLGAVLAFAMVVYVATHLELSAGVSHFLRVDSELELASVSAELADSALTRTMILSIAGPDAKTATRAAREWAEILAAHPEVASVQSGPREALSRAVYELYFPRRHFFLSDRPDVELPSELGDRGLRSAARALKRELALPGAEMVARVADADPLLAFPALLRRLEAARVGGLRVVDGGFVAGDPPSAILLLRSRHSAFDAGHQAPFGAFLEASFAELSARYGGALSLERSGVHRFAAASEARARADMTRISGISTLAILCLFLTVFRSLRLAALSLLPLAAGVLTAVTAGLLLFGQLHVITVAFGATLIGVCIDYPIHYVNHHTLLSADGSPWDSLRRVSRALVMGALTTVAGFVGLGWSDFPGVREIAVFAGVGVLAALGATAALLPPLVPAPARGSDLQRRLAGGLARLLGSLRRHRGPVVAIPLAAAALCLAGLPTFSFEDDVFALNVPLDPEWGAEDERVRARVSRMDAGRFVVAIGRDEQAALRLNDAVHERLSAARDANLLQGFRSLHSILWSEDLQGRNQRALSAQPELNARVLAALEAEGFRPEAFARFASTLNGDPPPPLQLEDLRRSALADFVVPFVVEMRNGVAVLTYLRGVADAERLERALAGLEGVHYFDQQRFVSQVYGRYRARTVRLVSAGMLAVLALLHLRYRRARLSLAAAAPAALAAATSLALLSLSGTPINLLHLLGLLLVLSFGVDYNIFLLESRASDREAAAALLSVGFACATTCLAFGLLATSSFPALRALGLTTAIGVLLSLALAPTALVLAGRERPAP